MAVKNIPFGTTAVITSLGQTATLGFTFSDIGLGGMDGVDTGQCELCESIKWFPPPRNAHVAGCFECVVAELDWESRPSYLMGSVGW
jgi:hypothetical protein